MSYAPRERSRSPIKQLRIAYRPDRKTASSITLFGVLYTVITGFIVLVFAAQAPYIADATITFFVMMVVSLSAMLFFGLVRFHYPSAIKGESMIPNKDRFIPAIILGMILVMVSQLVISNMGAIFFATIPFSNVVVPTNTLSFTMFTQAAIVEELMFTGFIQTTLLVLIRRVNNDGFKLIMDIAIPILLGVTFGLYHGAVYGSNLAALASVFVGRVVYAGVYEYTDTLDAPVLLHLLNNVMAGLPLLFGGI